MAARSTIPELFQRLGKTPAKAVWKENRSNDIKPGSQDSVKLLSGLWDQPVRHYNTAVVEKGSDTTIRGEEARNHHYHHWKHGKKAMKSETLENFWTKWTAQILYKGIYILSWKQGCKITAIPRDELVTRVTHHLTNSQIIFYGI